jgi:hypothetical protein
MGQDGARRGVHHKGDTGGRGRVKLSGEGAEQTGCRDDEGRREEWGIDAAG